MQAIERAVSSKDWITGVILLSFFILVLLKFLDENRLKGYFSFYFNKAFIETESFESPGFFSIFNMLFSFFSALNLSLLLLWIIEFYSNQVALSFVRFSMLFSILFSFQILQNFLQIVMMSLFSVKGQITTNLLVTQRGTLFSVSIFAFIVNMVFTYSGLEPLYLVYTAIFILGVAILFFINMNKKLIISKLFYFILYLCAFKLAPLLVLFKLIL